MPRIATLRVMIMTKYATAKPLHTGWVRTNLSNKAGANQAASAMVFLPSANSSNAAAHSSHGHEFSQNDLPLTSSECACGKFLSIAIVAIMPRSWTAIFQPKHRLLGKRKLVKIDPMVLPRDLPPYSRTLQSPVLRPLEVGHGQGCAAGVDCSRLKRVNILQPELRPGQARRARS
jgi:hypothetical protein